MYMVSFSAVCSDLPWVEFGEGPGWLYNFVFNWGKMEVFRYALIEAVDMGKLEVG